MKRVQALSLSASLMLLIGCSTASYNARLEKTLADKKYAQKLDQYLNPPVGEKFKELNIFLRPPKPLEQAKDFLLTSVPGLYEIEASFFDPAKANAASLRLHVLARHKAAVNRNTPKGAPPPPSVQRNEFKSDVLGLLANDFGATEQNWAKMQDTKLKSNAFKRVIFNAPSNPTDQVRLYLYNNKAESYDVALIWVVPADVAKDAAVTQGIDLSLESFAVGGKAVQRFATGGGEDESVGGGEGAPTNVF